MAGGNTWRDARVAIYSARVTITDPDGPNLGGASGALVSAGGYRRGSQAVAFGASDISGIKELRVYVDGALRASTARACDYTLTRPCSDPVSPVSLSVETSSLTDGPHDVRVAATDAAGNETRGGVHPIVVDNGAPASPQQLRSGADGAWQREPSVSLSWTNPPGQVAPITAARLRWCALDGTGCTTRDELVSGAQPVLGGVAPGEGAYVASVALIDAAGNVASSQASATVLHDATAPRAPEALSVAPRDPASATVQAAWREPADQRSPIAHARIRLCPAGSTTGCTPEQQSSAGERATSTIPGPGDWDLRVALVDAAGNVGTEGLVRLRHDTAAPASPTPLAGPPDPLPAPAPSATPTPAPPRPPTRRTPSLRAVSARLTAGRLVVRASVSPTATGPLRVTYSATVGKRILRTPPRLLRGHAGRFETTLRLPARLRTARGGTLELHYAGDLLHRPSVVRLTVRRR